TVSMAGADRGSRSAQRVGPESSGGRGEEDSVTAGAPPATGSDDAHATPTSSSTNVLAFAGFGLGVLGLATGGVAGLLAISKKTDTTERYCDGSSCPPAADHGLSSARTFATVSTIGFIAGAVGLG